MIFIRAVADIHEEQKARWRLTWFSQRGAVLVDVSILRFHHFKIFV